jgi:SagB-type dehydrogenase family enzyme
VEFEIIDDVLAATDSHGLWESFHENSKVSRFERHPTFVLHPSDHTIVRAMRRLRTVKPYRDRARVELPANWPASTRSFDDVLVERETARSFAPAPISLVQLAKILHMSYGVTRDNENTSFPRPFRAVPSGGALYPLELYLLARRVEGLVPGLYHYDPEDRSLDTLHLVEDPRDFEHIDTLLMQPELARDCAVIVFVSAIFFRSTFKYGDRGYRFVLLEAGHLAQNAILTAGEMGLASAPIGGFADRDVDRLLRFDGISESTVYLLLIGQPAP